ncbi:MAG TPA: TlpA disulfide reductase family protein [Ignavibacteriales bacterium]|nr:TlpA disulfide reductase family protein [Ignavibacteriales bacterium]
MRALFISMVILLTSCASLFSQAVTFNPLHPAQFDTVTVSYNLLQKKSAFSSKDSLFVIIWKYSCDEDVKTEWKLMEKSDSGFAASIYIDSNTAGVKLWFLTLYSKKFVGSSFMIYGKDDIPVRNAYRTVRDIGDSISMALELKHYPDNFLMYANKWSELKFDMSDSLEEIIKSDLKIIESKRIENAEKFYASAYAYALLQQQEICLKTLDTLIVKYPHSPVTLSAVQMVDAVFRTKADNEVKTRLTTIKDKIMKMNPDSRMTRFLTFSRHITDSSYEEICKKWISDEPENPEAYFTLAEIYLKNPAKLNLIPNLTEKAAELIAGGKLRLYDDISGKLSDMLYTECYFTQAEAYKAQKQYFLALNSIKASDPLEPYSIRRAKMMEGELWLKLANYDKAEKAYLDAWNSGEAEAKEEIKKIYLKRALKDDFENYFARKTKTDDKTGNKSSVELNKQLAIDKPKESAPEFDVTSFDGKRFKLSELKGKVIVANFWFTGCTPCKDEIPALNKLVDKYKDCVFLAFSLDEDKGRLKRFLAKYPFRFNVIPDASDVTGKFKVRSFPSTIIISPEGKIHHFEVGGANNINDVLSVKIDELLNK